MMPFSEILSTALQNLWTLLPFKVSVVSSWERGVLFQWGVPVRVLKPGMHIVWHILSFQTLTEVTIAPEVIETQTISATTRDGISCALSLAIHYKVCNPVRYLTKIQDPEASLRNLAEALATYHTSDFELSELITAQDQLLRAIEGQLKETTMGWGLRILQLGLCNFCKTIPLRHMGSTFKAE